jgi:hypothetical protein
MAQIAKSRVGLQSDHAVTFFFVFPYAPWWPTTFADLTIAVAESLTGPLGFEAISRLRRIAEGPY